jgi:hypothetical protein
MEAQLEHIQVTEQLSVDEDETKDMTIYLPERKPLLDDSVHTPTQNWGSFQDQAVIMPPHLAPDFYAGKLAGSYVELHFTEKNSASLRLILVGDTVVGRSGAIINLDYFNAASLGVSREHIMLRPAGSKLYLLDMDSKNGTLLNGVLISASRAYPLGVRDVITLGKLSFTLHIVGIGQSARTDQEFRSRGGQPFA